MAFIPCLCPWEIEFESRLDVVRKSNHLLVAIEMELVIVSHMRTPGTTFTCAHTPALRYSIHPLGVSGLPPRLQQLVDQGNELVFATCRLIQALWLRKRTSR